MGMPQYYLFNTSISNSLLLPVVWFGLLFSFHTIGIAFLWITFSTHGNYSLLSGLPRHWRMVLFVRVDAESLQVSDRLKRRM